MMGKGERGGCTDCLRTLRDVLRWAGGGLLEYPAATKDVGRCDCFLGDERVVRRPPM